MKILLTGEPKSGKTTLLAKLLNNAIVYVAQARVKEILPNSFTVQGNHSVHHVRFDEGAFGCDCDFFNGRSQFVGKAGECSHVQAVKILEWSET